jgi:hypothetical protein
VKTAGVALAVLLAALLTWTVARPDPAEVRQRDATPPAQLSPPVVGNTRPRPTVSSTPRLARARDAARLFLRGYLPFLYGRAPARRIKNVTARVRASLARGHSRSSPARRGRRARVVGIRLVGQSRRTAIATATIDDRSAARYRLTFTLARHGPRWLVSELGGD